MSRAFDAIVAVDWSARATPSPRRPSADAIWLCVARAGETGPPEYHRTRASALDRIETLLVAEIAAGRRALVGFDFPFGWPRGLARAVTGRDEALALWEWLGREIADGPDNASNRFAVAERINAVLPGVGPFWGRPATAPHPGVPARGSLRRGHGLPERRLVEDLVRSAQPCWKLYTTGSVGSQALLGVAALERLRRRSALAGKVAVWPFESGLAPGDAPVTLAEIYPSLWEAEPAADEPKDAAQVRAVARELSALDAGGALAPLFTAGEALTEHDRAAVAREEGWILGAGKVAARSGPSRRRRPRALASVLSASAAP